MSDLKNTLTTLNAEFAIEGQLKFKINAHDQITLCIDTSHAQAEIVLQGAHLIHWQPRDQQAVIWLSEDAVFAAGKSLRGGVPVCWPWFGAHADNEKFPAHG